MRRISVLLFLLFAVTAAIAQEQSVTPELIMTLKNAQDVQISPDASRVLFTLNRPRVAGEKPGVDWQEIWMVSTKDGVPVRFTSGVRSDRSPRWSADRQIAFLSNRGSSEKDQIYLIKANGGEATALTSFKEGVDSIAWSPDGTCIAFTMTDSPSREETENEQAGKDWQVADENYRFRRVYVLELATGKHWQVTRDAMNVWEYEWSPDGSQFLILASRTPHTDDQYMASQIYTVAATGGDARLVVKTEGKLESPTWSPDGKWIAWRGASKLSDPDSGCIFIASIGGGKAENLTPAYEGSATFIKWAKDSKSILFGGIERQDTVIRSVDVSSRKISEVLVKGLNFNTPPSFAESSAYALIASTPQHPPEIFLIEPGSEPRRLTSLNPQFEKVRLARQEIIKWKSYDGLEIEGILVKPLDYEQGRRYPLFVQYHGGPEAADTNGWYATVTRWGQMLAARGIATLYPNYRGSIGRGIAFAEANQGDMMGKEFDDALAGIDHLVKMGLVDGDKVALGGGSYGGYAAAWAATRYSNRFKLAVVWMGGTNRVSKVGTADNYKEESIVHWRVDPYDNYDLYWDRSPIKYIKQAQTPTLILHGEKDPRVPVSQGKELYTALKWRGVPVEFVVYPREGHGVRERMHQMDFLQRILKACEKYLK